jgi:hypothetical protein
MVAPRQWALRLLPGAVALLFVALAIAGGIRAYSPVPFWDMWGSVSFMDYAADSGWHAWWTQHNEHRIVLARLLFWSDLRWFDGAGWFLVAANYALVAAAVALFWRLLGEVEVPHGRAADMRALKLFAVIWLFFWSQHENLTWAFQSQFFLAQLLPLAALYTLYRALKGAAALFALACLLGVLSVGTMANGVLALPLMTVYAMLTRQGGRRIGVLALLAALTLFAYFHDYVAPAAHGSLAEALLGHPLKFVGYVLYYLGSPFHFAFGARGIGRLAALLASLFFVGSALRFAAACLRQPRQASFQLALLFFIAYVAGTAVGTAGGRLVFGLSQALTSRYTTPVLMAWAALMVLYAPALLALQERRRRSAWGAFAVLALLMLAYQLRALQSKADDMFDRSVAALAIELRIKDQEAIGHVAPNTGVIEAAARAADRQRSVFGMYPYRGARAAMGAAFAPVALPVCQGALNSAVVVPGDEGFLRVSGWLYEPRAKAVPQVVRILDAGGRQRGYALGGKDWNAAEAALHKASHLAGYRGYLSTEQGGRALTLRGEGPGGPICELQVRAPTAQPNKIIEEEKT